MVMLIKCWQHQLQHQQPSFALCWMLVVLTTSGWIVGGVECIKNGDVGVEHHHHHQHQEDIDDVVDAFHLDDVESVGGRGEG